MNNSLFSPIKELPNTLSKIYIAHSTSTKFVYNIMKMCNNKITVINEVNKIPNNCIDYIYENAEIYDSANDEYIGDHKFSCGLVDESDESKYIELFARKGWIFEKYVN